MTGTKTRWRPETKRQHAFRPYGAEELICHCGYVAPFYKLPAEQAELNTWLKSEGGFACYGVHHSDLSRLIASCGDKISDRWSWARKCETALKLTGRFTAA